METLILLHGFTETSSMWDFVKDLGIKGVNLQYVDVNSYFKKPTSLAEVAAKIIEKHSEASSVSVVGHSMGGYIACEMLHQSTPNLVGISLLNSTPDPDSSDKKENRDKSIDFIKEHGSSMYLTSLIPKLYMPNTDPSTIEHHIMTAEHIPATVLQNQLAAMRDRKDLRQIFIQKKVCKQWILGEQDPLIEVKKILNTIPEFDEIFLHLDKKSGHMTYVENKSFAQNTVTDFVSYKK